MQAVGEYEFGTCRSAQGNWSTIDYFVVSRHLQEAVQHLHTVGAGPPKPHLPVRLKLNANPRQYREQVLKRVKQFPLHVPVGPSPKPPEWSTVAVTHGLTGQERLNALHAFTVQGIESELADIYGIHGEERKLHTGRDLCLEAGGWRPEGGQLPCVRSSWKKAQTHPKAAGGSAMGLAAKPGAADANWADFAGA